MTESISPELAKRVVPASALQSPILCGTDFSPMSAEAIEVGVALARRLGSTLMLVHAVDEQSRQSLPMSLRKSLREFEHAQFQGELDRLRAAKVEVSGDSHQGRPEAVLAERSLVEHALLLVISSHQLCSRDGKATGSLAQRVAEASPIPTLVVRVAAPLVNWSLGKRKLRIFVKAELGASTDAALSWIGWLRQMGECEAVVTHPFVPEGPLAESVRQRLRVLLGGGRIRVRLETSSDAHLLEAASAERADLVVIGMDGCGESASQARAVLHSAPMSVACVPLAQAS